MKTKINLKAACKKVRFHKNSNAFFHQLQELDNRAILYLHQKTLNHLKAKNFTSRVTIEDAEELANDAVMLVLQKISNGDYQFQGFNPLTYTFIVADNLLRNFSRKKRFFYCSIEEVELSKAPEVESYFAKKEKRLKIGKAMSALSPAGQQVIKLKFFDGLTDKEIIEEKLTIYSTVDSLKNRRCQHLKKMANYMRLQNAA